MSVHQISGAEVEVKCQKSQESLTAGADACATSEAASAIGIGSTSRRHIPNYAQDTIKEVLGWYGLQEPLNGRDDEDFRPSDSSVMAAGASCSPCSTDHTPSPPVSQPSSSCIISSTASPVTAASPLDLTNGHSPLASSSSEAVGTQPASTSWSGHRKLIGMRFLFPPLSDDLSLLDKARIWVARHEHKYFVGWTQEELDRVDPLLRPIMTITPEMYKLHMNRSEYCRNVKLKYCLESDADWARDFQLKLSKPPSEGGFTGLCQAKIAAAELWRKYSENYRSHQARYPNPKSKRGKESCKRTVESEEGVTSQAEEEEEEKRVKEDMSDSNSGATMVWKEEDTQEEAINGHCEERKCPSPAANKLKIADLTLQGLTPNPVGPVYLPMPLYPGIMSPFAQAPFLPGFPPPSQTPLSEGKSTPGHSPTPSKNGEKNSEYKRSERGLSFLFPSLSDHNLSLMDKVRITVLRHKSNYFLGWSEEELAKVDPLVRPKMLVTHEIYKEYCHRNAMKYDSNLQFAMESEEDWAVEFRSKLLKPPSDGGFSSLCEVKLEAGRLWREYSGKYRMHNIVKWQMDLNSAKVPKSEPEINHSALDIKPDLSGLGATLHRSASLSELTPPTPPHIVRGHKRSRSSVCSSPSANSLISPSSSSEASKAVSPDLQLNKPSNTPDTGSKPSTYDAHKDFLFLPLPRHLSVADQLFIWLERHKNSYFLGYSKEELLHLNEYVRPSMVVTEEVFKRFIPESMVDVLNKIEHIMRMEDSWARLFQERVHKPFSKGGFSSFEEALTEAVVLWHAHDLHNKVDSSSFSLQPQKNVLFTEWVNHHLKSTVMAKQQQKVAEMDTASSPPSASPSRAERPWPRLSTDIWACHAHLRALCRDDPARSLHSKLQPYLPILRLKLGASYALPSSSNECIVDLVFALLQSHIDLELSSSEKRN